MIPGYTPNHWTGVAGSYKCGEIYASYATLRRLLGEPYTKHCTSATIGDGAGKVSTQWVFRSDSGAVITVYDYKATSLYSRDLPTPEQFRRQRRLFCWSVGAHSKADADAIIAALLEAT